MGQGLKFGFGDKTNCRRVSGPVEAPRMQSVMQCLRAGVVHGGELLQAGLAHGGDSVHSVSPVLMGVDALHQLKNDSEARVGSPGARVVAYQTRVLGA